jgi:hypothetical protein
VPRIWSAPSRSSRCNPSECHCARGLEIGIVEARRDRRVREAAKACVVGGLMRTADSAFLELDRSSFTAEVLHAATSALLREEHPLMSSANDRCCMTRNRREGVFEL